jgi:pilus assembly protein CpaD
VPAAGAEPVNIPVVTRTEYAFDLSAPGGNIPPAEAARLSGWFAGMDLRYGDTVYVEGGAYSEAARAQVADIASNYGILVSPGAPVTAGAVAPDSVRVVVSRNVASVPNCPNWERKASPNYNNKTMPNFGCGVNSNLAAMVANPEDLIHGREGSGVGDATTAAKAINVYRTKAPTGTGELKDVSTKSGGSK